MGKLYLVCRLAIKDIRHRQVQAVLLLLAIAAGTTTLTLGLALRGTSDDPYARTRVAARGPDVVAAVLPNGSNAPGPATKAGPGDQPGPGPSGPGSLLRLEHVAGVAAASGPFPVTWTPLRTGNTSGSAEAEGRSTAPSAVDRPKLTQGTWVRPGGVVVEASFASALGVRVGGRLTLAGYSFDITGTAVSAAIPAYPGVCGRPVGCFLTGKLSTTDPGLVWVTQADAARIAGGAGSTPVAYVMNLKLKDPGLAQQFADRYNARAGPTAPYLYSWQSIRAGDADVIAKIELALVTGSWLLALLAVASVVVLVGGRMAEQTRRVGLLKAVGGTPGLVAMVLLAEHVLVGVCAAVAGLVAGLLLAPLLDGPGAGLIGAPSAPSLSVSTVGAVLGLALAVAIVATLVPAVRAARQSTVVSLADSARAPRRLAGVIRLSAHLPAALLIGARLAVRRPRRLLLSVFSIAVTASGIVAVMMVHRNSTYQFLGSRVSDVLTLISVMLVVLAAVNALIIAWVAAIDARRSAAVAQALGATPDQITAGLAVAQLIPAVAGALLGIPGGLAVTEIASKGNGTATIPPALWLVVMVALISAAIAVLTAIPARIGARRPVAEALQAETR